MAKGMASAPDHLNQAHNASSFVEFETSADLKTAVEKLDGQTFKGAVVHCSADVSLHGHR